MKKKAERIKPKKIISKMNNSDLKWMLDLQENFAPIIKMRDEMKPIIDLRNSIMTPEIIKMQEEMKPMIEFQKSMTPLILKIQELYSPLFKNVQNLATFRDNLGLNYEEIFKQLSIGESYSNFTIENLLYKDYNLAPFESIEEEEKSEIIIIDETSRIKRIITDIYKNNNVIFNIKPREFEEVIAELLSSQGFAVELTKQTRDNGYDIIALKYLDGYIPFKFLVECKRFKTGKVGVGIIREFRDVILTEKANRGMIVTTSYFSSESHKKQKETPHLLEFKDRDNVLEWVYNYKNNR